jgi:nicotinamide mononucleotide (NMN) deamidase PncC
MVRAEVDSNLKTVGAYSEETVMQLAALALKHDINITSTARPEQGVHTTYFGTQEGEGAKGTIHFLLRDHKTETIFNAQFRPIAVADGHFWLIRKEGQGNGGGSALARP